jgi:membrane protein DedA with SNARE-associated domain
LDRAIEMLIRNGLLVLFAGVLVGQLGFPIPSTALLLAAGTLAYLGKLSLLAVVSVAVVASMLAHLAWYEAGRRGGRRVLRWICSISLEPDTCVRSAETSFERFGSQSLILGHFLPGLGLVVQPLAAIAGMGLGRFIVFNGFGTLLWAAGYTGLGYVFGREIERFASGAISFGTKFAVGLGVVLAGYLAWKWTMRQKLLRALRTARIEPEELKRRLDSGEPLLVVDLRHTADIAADPWRIPGAIQLSPDELENGQGLIPEGKEIVLYCT